MPWWVPVVAALISAGVSTITAIAVTRRQLSATEVRGKSSLERAARERSLTIAADLHAQLSAFIAACTSPRLQREDFYEHRRRWSEAVRAALPEVMPEQPVSRLRGLLNRSHEEVLRAEQYWIRYGNGAGKARLNEALDVCYYTLKSLSEYRTKGQDAAQYSSRSIEEAKRSVEYWGLSVAEDAAAGDEH